VWHTVPLLQILSRSPINPTRRRMIACLPRWKANGKQKLDFPALIPLLARDGQETVDNAGLRSVAVRSARLGFRGVGNWTAVSLGATFMAIASVLFTPQMCE